MSASIGQGRSHGSRGQVDKSPFPARRSVAEKKDGADSAREGGGIGGDERRNREGDPGSSHPRFEGANRSDPKETISENHSLPI